MSHLPYPSEYIVRELGMLEGTLGLIFFGPKIPDIKIQRSSRYNHLVPGSYENPFSTFPAGQIAFGVSELSDFLYRIPQACL